MNSIMVDPIRNRFQGVFAGVLYKMIGNALAQAPTPPNVLMPGLGESTNVDGANVAMAALTGS